MSEQGEPGGRFDVLVIAASLPDRADSMMADHYLTDKPSGSVRIFRVYRPVAAHFHRGCDEHLYVLSGRGTFWMGDPSCEAPFAPGQLIVFDKETYHCIPKLLEHPVVFLAIDTPRRRPDDVNFLNPEDGDAAEFMARNSRQADST